MREILQSLYEICEISPTLSKVVVLASVRGEYVPQYSWEKKLVALPREEKEKLLRIACDRELLCAKLEGVRCRDD